MESGRGERLAARLPSSVRRGPESARFRAFSLSLHPACALAQARRSMDRHHRQRWMLFNNLPQVDLGTGRWFALHLCGCSSAGRARPRHGRGHEFETRHPLHFGCVHALRGHATWCWWSGMCAVLGQITCSETPHPTGMPRVWAQPKWNHTSPRSSAGRAAAL